MNLLEILQKELTEFPEGMLYAVQDDDGEVKFGKHSHPTLGYSGIWQRREDGKNLTIPRLELAEDWDSAIVTKDMWENDRVKQIIVDVSGLTTEEKQRVNEALAKITGANKMSVTPSFAVWFLAPASSGAMRVAWDTPSSHKAPTHTPNEVMEMAGMAKQGHVHSHLMAQYAEDAKTTDKPWELWQLFTKIGTWVGVDKNPDWCADIQYRRKPKTHIVNGVEVSDLRFVPKKGDRYYVVDPSEPEFTYIYTSSNDSFDIMWAERGLCYEPTEEGKQAAILHAKAWVGIAQ